MKSKFFKGQKNFMTTQNQMGYMMTYLVSYMLDFVDFAKQAQKPVLDIGAAYGVASLAAFEDQGFIVEKCAYLPRPEFPDDLRYDGRESVGLIARKE